MNKSRRTLVVGTMGDVGSRVMGRLRLAKVVMFGVVAPAAIVLAPLFTGPGANRLLIVPVAGLVGYVLGYCASAVAVRR